MEAAALALRSLGLLALAVLVGGTVFLLICSKIEAAPERDRLWRLGRWLPAAWAVHLVSSIGALGLRAALVAYETSGGIIEPDAIGHYVRGTHAGQVAAARVLLATLMAVPLYCLGRRRMPAESKGTLAILLCIAGTVAVLPALAGHIAAYDATRALAPIQMVHLLALSVWLGALPFWIAHVRQVASTADRERLVRLERVLRAFSRTATLCVVAIGASGVALAWVYIETAGDLLGTRYGLLLCTKVVLFVVVLAIANRLRTRLLPALSRSEGAPNLPVATQWVSLELGLATTVAVLGSTMADTTPAMHEQAIWLLGRRLSWAATWPLPATPFVVTAGVALALLALAWLATAGRRRSPGFRTLLLIVAAGGLGGAIWQLSVPAYPETYRRSAVPYLTVSIANGMRQFAENCVSCHGPGALGDGPRATSLPKPPADLSEPHTALHTVGDMFWWLTHGIPQSGMPGFPEQLDEQSRWDVINFLRAFSEGYQARTLGTEIVPEGPWLGAPNFYFEDDTGQLKELKDYRERTNVLLVFPATGPDADDRRRALSAWSAALRMDRTQVLFVSPAEQPSADGVAVVDELGEIRQTYDLLSRTTRNRGDARHLGMQRDHMEFLIDRFGYIRARWIPGESDPRWLERDHLLSQVRALNAEPRVRPPPDDHVH